MPKIARKLMAHYIDTALPAGPVAYARLGADLEEYTTEMNANVNTKQNILGDSSTDIDGYEPQSSVEPYIANDGDPMFTRLQDIVDKRSILDDLKTTVVDVHLWDEVEATPGSYVAYKEDAVIEVVSYGGDTVAYQIPFNIYNTGNRVKGKFALATKTFTPDV